MISKLYKILLKYYGKQKWWPYDKEYHSKMGTDYRVEIIVGAILTQNTTWKNVEKALRKLKDKKMLHIEKIATTSKYKISNLIISSGFYNQKAKRIIDFFRFVRNRYTSLNKLFSLNIYHLRKELISIKGIGRETADSIILYAANKPIFVVDTYTKRIFSRVGIIKGNEDYDFIRKIVEKEINNVNDLKEFHALLVEHGKKFCKKNPLCSGCPLSCMCLFKKYGPAGN